MNQIGFCSERLCRRELPDLYQNLFTRHVAMRRRLADALHDAGAEDSRMRRPDRVPEVGRFDAKMGDCRPDNLRDRDDQEHNRKCYTARLQSWRASGTLGPWMRMAIDVQQTGGIYRSVDLGRRQAGVSEQFLESAKVGATGKQMGGEAVP